MTILQILWFFLIFVLIAGYFVLDGFDLGAGVLYPILAKNETERAYIRRSIGPVWDGNEVWLLTAGGAFSLAWRCLDAQFWGVAQRRKRIFLLADFAGPLAPQLLFDVFGETGNCGKEVT